MPRHTVELYTYIVFKKLNLIYMIVFWYLYIQSSVLTRANSETGN